METMKWAVLPQKQCDVPVDLMEPEKCQVHGALFMELKTPDVQGRMLVYIPKSWNNNDPVLVAASPEKMSEEEFICQYGVCDFAENRGVLLAVIRAEKEDHGEKTSKLLNAAYKKLQGREYFVAMQDCFYTMGFEEGSQAVLKAMLTMGSDWSGAAFFGQITDETQMEFCPDQDQGIQSEEMFISGKKGQLPVWFLEQEETEALKAVKAYWMMENHAQQEPVYDSRKTEIYMPKNLSRISSINDAQISQVRVTLGYHLEDLTEDLLSYVWDYIGAARRHRSYGNKVLRYYRDPAVKENGADYHQMVVGGMKREWYEYIPERFRDTDKKLPVVVVFHGRGGNGQSFFDITDMSLVAEERGFIALFPTADLYQIRPEGYRGVRLWNGNYQGTEIDSMPFVRAMIKDLQQRQPVDDGRIYACGQSSGGYMAACCAYQASDLFAAVAPWSGFTFPGAKGVELPTGAEKEIKGVPIYLLAGKKDAMFGAPVPNISDPQCQLDQFLRYVLEENEMEMEYDTYECYPIEYYIWRKNGVPMLTLGLVDDMPHANYAEESRISYDDFLCRFHKDASGKRYYMGREIK